MLLRIERRARSRPVFDRVKERIGEGTNRRVNQRMGSRTTAKQRITGSSIHRELLAEGFKVGITVVRDYLHQRRLQAGEVSVPLIHRPGEEAQVDFFEVVIDLKGVRRKAWMFLMRLM